MKKVIFLLLSLTSSFNLHAQDTAAIHKCLVTNLPSVTLMVKNRIKGARYMEEGKPVSTTDQLDGYKGIKVSLYRYHWPPKGNLVAYVYLLDADFDRIARWLITSAYKVRGEYRPTDIKMLLDTIDNQSNAQFPVLGVVFENTPDNFNSPFIYFKDGITVKVKPAIRSRFKFDTVYTDASKKQRQITFSQDNLSLITKSNLVMCYFKGRIISTTRKQYQEAGGKENVDGFNFMQVVRDEYVKALNSDYNFMIYARARRLLK